MSIERVAVIGAGTMGQGIVETAAVHGLRVDVAEPDQEQQRRALVSLTASIERGIKRGKLSLADPDEALTRIRWHASISEAACDAPFVIEAVPESEELKTDIFVKLDAVCSPEAILASNTSSISITRLATATNRSERIVGMHFFNPVPVMEPVEVVRGETTSKETVATTFALAERMGKQAFEVADSPGFAVNRVLMPLINEAVFALEEGVADAKTIDSLMKLGCHHPMGPLELADFVGLDVCLSILQVLEQGLGDEKFHACPLLARMVASGRLGRKSGQGFYTYEK